MIQDPSEEEWRWRKPPLPGKNKKSHLAMDNGAKHENSKTLVSVPTPEGQLKHSTQPRVPLVYLPPKKRRVDSAASSSISLEDLPMKKRTLVQGPYSYYMSSDECSAGYQMGMIPVPSTESNIIPVQVDGTPKQIVCSICGREFPSFRALGGHKAHCKKRQLVEDEDEDFVIGPHNKKRRPSKVNAKSSCSDTIVVYEPINIDAAPLATRSYQCAVCERNFSSGQALGGHKRYCNGLTMQGVVAQSNSTMVGVGRDELVPNEVLGLPWYE